MRCVRELEAGVPDRRAHAVAALADGRVGQPHHREVGKPERDVHFDVDGIGFDAEDGGAAQHSEHRAFGLQEPTRAGVRAKSACLAGVSAARAEGSQFLRSAEHPEVRRFNEWPCHWTDCQALAGSYGRSSAAVRLLHRRTVSGTDSRSRRVSPRVFTL